MVDVECRKGCRMRRRIFLALSLVLLAALICPLASSQDNETGAKDAVEVAAVASIQENTIMKFYQDYPNLFLGAFVIMLLALGVITFLGLYAVYHGITKLEGELGGNKNYKSIFIIIVGLIIFFAGLYYLTMLFFQPFIISHVGGTQTKDPPMWALIGVSALVFFMLIGMGTWRGSIDKMKDMDQGQIRSAIAGTLVFGFIMLTLFSLYYGVTKDNMIVTQYGNFVGIVIGFYFGARTASQAASEGADIAKGTADDGKVKKGIKLESVKLLDKNKLELYIFNATDKQLEIKEAKVGDLTAATNKTTLERGKLNQISASLDANLENGKYRISIITKTGESGEICIMVADSECALIKCSEVPESP